MKNDNHVSTTILVSGTTIKIGVNDEDKGPSSVWFQTDENPEPIYMSPVEARLMRAALKAAIAEAEVVELR